MSMSEGYFDYLNNYFHFSNNYVFRERVSLGEVKYLHDFNAYWDYQILPALIK